jgi:hypothetical protein
MIRASVLAGLFVCAGFGMALAAPVTHVNVQVSSAETPIPMLAQKRIAASIQTVGNHVFLNKDDAEIRASADSYNRVVNDIINRVLIGYTVDDISISPGPETTMAVRIRPWGETIRSVHVTVDYGSLPPMGVKMANGDLQGVESMVQNLLIGLPVDSLDWANGAVKSVMETELMNMLPEFYPHITITSNADAEVKIYLMPQLPVVRNVNVIVDAENLPKVIFLKTRKNLEQKYAGLEGLPVNFVRRHEHDVLIDLQDSLAQQWVIKQYKLRVLPTLNIGENIDINLKSETDFYDIQAGAYIDMNRKDRKNDKDISDDHTVITAHVGRKVGTHHEFFSELEFKPASVKWNFIPGYFYHWGKNTMLGYQYETEDNSNHLWLRQHLGGRWGIRYDRDLTNEDDEVGLTYKLHEYISLEYIVSDHDNWLRIIGYL